MNRDALKYRAAVAADERAIKELLAMNDLPYDDLTLDHLQHFSVVRNDQQYVGVVGIEIAGRDALLRSLAVAHACRGQGIASRLVQTAETYARLLGIERLYLLTTTASEFFAKGGYKHTARDAAPPAIQATREFQSLCPSTAACMSKRL